MLCALLLSNMLILPCYSYRVLVRLFQYALMHLHAILGGCLAAHSRTNHDTAVCHWLEKIAGKATHALNQLQPALQHNLICEAGMMDVY